MIEKPSIDRQTPTVDSFLDVDMAQSDINTELLRVFEQPHIAALWWNVANPRLDGKTPISLWNANPYEFPRARAQVYRAAMTILRGMTDQSEKTTHNMPGETNRALGALALGTLHIVE